MANSKLIFFFVFGFIAISCNETSPENHNKKTDGKGGCKTINRQFNYPADLNELEKLKNICNNSIYSDVAKNKKVDLYVKYDDEKYSILMNNSYTYILVDKKEKVRFCFFRLRNYPDFNSKTIYKIFILDNKLMPQYSIEHYPKLKNDIIEKYFYEVNNPYLSYQKILLETPIPAIENFKYDDLLRFADLLECKKYKLINEKCNFEFEKFKETPFWMVQ